MGCGKSTLAKEIYKKTRKMILDSDKIIENNEGKSISEIFLQKGEAYFRNLEQEFCTFAEENIQNSIIATGGGMPMFCDIKRLGKVFFMHLEFDEIYNRLDEEGFKTRPLFQNKESAHSLFLERLEQYKKSAHLILDANDKIEVLANTIIKSL